MAVDDRLEQRLRVALHDDLDRAVNPYPTWADAPARRQIELGRPARRRPGRPVLLLAAALLVSAALGGTLIFGSRYALPAVTDLASPGSCAPLSITPVTRVALSPMTGSLPRPAGWTYSVVTDSTDYPNVGITAPDLLTQVYLVASYAISDTPMPPFDTVGPATIVTLADGMPRTGSVVTSTGSNQPVKGIAVMYVEQQVEVDLWAVTSLDCYPSREEQLRELLSEVDPPHVGDWAPPSLPGTTVQVTASDTPGPSAAAALASARARWQARAPATYSYTFIHRGPSGLGWDFECQVSSTGGHVEMARLGGGTSPDCRADNVTVEALFDQVGYIMARGADTSVDYDPDLGYPTNITWSSQAADDAGTDTITDFVGR